MALSVISRAETLVSSAEALVTDAGEAIHSMTIAEARELLHRARELKGWAIGLERLITDYAMRPQS